MLFAIRNYHFNLIFLRDIRRGRKSKPSPPSPPRGLRVAGHQVAGPGRPGQLSSDRGEVR